jgi:hypothetical protein
LIMNYLTAFQGTYHSSETLSFSKNSAFW